VFHSHQISYTGQAMV